MQQKIYSNEFHLINLINSETAHGLNCVIKPPYSYLQGVISAN